jgi:hypothetical protein
MVTKRDVESSASYSAKHWNTMQVMGDFQQAQRQRLEEPVADIGLEPLCAIVSTCRLTDLRLFIPTVICWVYYMQRRSQQLPANVPYALKCR